MTDIRRCVVCNTEIHPLAKLCKRCRKLVNRGAARRKTDRRARIEALRRAWDGEYFRCHFSDVRLVETDHHDPRYLAFDHRTPRQEHDVVVASACINDMKSDMTEAEFRAVVLQLASRFHGGSFDHRVLELKHWKR